MIIDTLNGSLHPPQDFQSLLMHREAVRLVVEEETLIDRLLVARRA